MSYGGSWLKFQMKMTDRGVEKQIDRLRTDFKQDSVFIRDSLKQIGVLYKEVVVQRFRDEVDPRGKPWADLSAVTLKYKAKGMPWAGRQAAANPNKIGEWTQDLVNGIRVRTYRNEIVVGTNVGSYAHTFHYGAKKGSFGKFRSSLKTGRTKKGLGKLLKSPWGDIPPRNFLGFDTNTNDRILNLLQSRLTYNRV
jgi:phage gpG-like protein